MGVALVPGMEIEGFYLEGWVFLWVLLGAPLVPGMEIEGFYLEVH